MLLTNLEIDGTLLLAAEGETKTVTMTNDDTSVPYLAWYSMPDGYATWLSIVTNGNVFTITAQNNLFEENEREIDIEFFCAETSADVDAPDSQIVTVTQSGDTISLTFNPTSGSLAYTAGDTEVVTITGVPVGAAMSVLKPDWLDVSLDSTTQMTITGALNTDTNARTGSVVLIVNDRAFFYSVTQAANALSLTFDPTGVELDYTSGSTDDVTITGIPVGAEVTVAAPEWLDAALAGGTLTLTADENPDDEARSGSVSVSLLGQTFYIAVSQDANPAPNGTVVLDQTSYLFGFAGGSLVVTATALPLGETSVTCSSPEQGSCAECGDTGDFVTFTRLSPTSYKIEIDPQNIFEGIERSHLLSFTAGEQTATFTITQSAPPSVHRLVGMGDKFIKYAASSSLPTFFAESTVASLLSTLKAEEWEKLTFLVTPTLVGATRDNIPLKRKQLDCYKGDYAQVTVDGANYQKIGCGAAAYRFEFDTAVYGQTIRGLVFDVRTDAYCAAGVRVALQLASAVDTPSSDWAVVRAGTGSFSKTGFATRILKTDNMYYGVKKTVIFDDLDVTIDADTRFYLYLTMEDYTGVRNGWVYGSGLIVPRFEFYADSLAGGVAEDQWITVSDIDSASSEVPVSEGGIVAVPAIAAQEACPTREVLQRELVIGNENVNPTDSIAFAALPTLFASVSQSGLAPVDMSAHPFSVWPSGQLGLTASLARQVGGPTSPFQNLLRYTVSPILIFTSVPIDATVGTLRLTHRAGLDTVQLAGANVSLSAYWFAGQKVTIEDLKLLSANPKFCEGGAEIAAGSLKGTLLGTVALPESIDEGSSITIAVDKFAVRWGTLMLVPWIVRVTATALSIGQEIGLAGVRIDDGSSTGQGWFPNIKLEV